MTLTKDIVPRSVAIVVFLGFAYVQRPFDGAIAYWLVVPLTTAALALLFLSRNLPADTFRARLPDVDVARELWSFSWPLAVGTSLILLMSNLDVLMIGYFLQSDDVGFYRSVQPLRQITQFVLQSFVFLFLPLATSFYSRGDFDQLRTLYTTASKWVAVLTLPFVLVFSLFSEDVVRVFFGVEYLPSAPALSILTAGLFFNALVGPNGAMIKALDQSKLEMYAAGVGVVVNIVLNVVLIPQFGIVGAAVATVVGYVAFNIVEVSAIYWVSGAHPFSLNTLKPLVLTTVVGIGLARITSALSLNLPALIGIGILLLIVQAGAIVATRSLDEADTFIYQKALDRLK
jgi:O-antigen/teichoic acid export membrane protein